MARSRSASRHTSFHAAALPHVSDFDAVAAPPPAAGRDPFASGRPPAATRRSTDSQDGLITSFHAQHAAPLPVLPPSRGSSKFGARPPSQPGSKAPAAPPDDRSAAQVRPPCIGTPMGTSASLLPGT